MSNEVVKENGHDDGDWQHYEVYVLQELKAIRSDFKEHVTYDQGNFKELQTTLTELKTKVAVWGTIIAGAAALAQPIITSLIARLF